MRNEVGQSKSGEGRVQPYLSIAWLAERESYE
jgi:hypothetical protein